MFSQDVPRQNLLKSVDVRQSYSKTRNVPSSSETQSIIQYVQHVYLRSIDFCRIPACMSLHAKRNCSVLFCESANNERKRDGQLHFVIQPNGSETIIAEERRRKKNTEKKSRSTRRVQSFSSGQTVTLQFRDNWLSPGSYNKLFP